MLKQFIQNIKIFSCPICKGNLKVTLKSKKATEIVCRKCDKKFSQEDDIPLCYISDKKDTKNVTKDIKNFYEEFPFPNYNDIDNVDRLISKAKNGIFAKLLDEQIPFNSYILEVGCGTGQLSNFLSIKNRNVFGVDLSLNSLKLGNKFKKENNLERVGFYQMNIFYPIFKPESFHYVISNGVLHHTKDAHLAFLTISKLVKKNGYIIIGLYNKYGRLITDFRRLLFHSFGKSLSCLDPNLKGKEMGETKKKIWYQDQYENPHETKHTVSEVLSWFDETGFEFVKCIPKLNISHSFSLNENLFEQNEKISKINIALSEFAHIFKGSKEGGLFIMIGKKK